VPAAFCIAKDGQIGDDLVPPHVPGELFRIFWTSGISDFHVPLLEIKEIDRKISKKIVDAGDDSNRIVFLKKLQETIRKDCQDQKARLEKIRETLKGKTWFAEPEGYRAFLSECVVPRIMFSEMDSLFVSRFIFALAHFSDCFDLTKCTSEFTRVLHHIVFGATREECRGLGLLIAKLLKFQQKRSEERAVHDEILEKVRLVLERKSLYVISNVLMVLDEIVKYFPKYAEHETAVDAMISKLEIPAGHSTEMSVKVYMSNRKRMKSKLTNKKSDATEKVAGKQMKRVKSNENVAAVDEGRREMRSAYGEYGYGWHDAYYHPWYREQGYYGYGYERPRPPSRR
jgi:hypothetical protein